MLDEAKYNKLEAAKILNELQDIKGDLKTI